MAYDLEHLKKELAAKFTEASGHSVKNHGIDEWERLAHILVEGVVQIVRAEIHGDGVTRR